MNPGYEYYHRQVGLHEHLSLGWADQQSEPSEPHQGLHWLLLFPCQANFLASIVPRLGEICGVLVVRLAPTGPTTTQSIFPAFLVGACCSSFSILPLPSTRPLWM